MNRNIIKVTQGCNSYIEIENGIYLNEKNIICYKYKIVKSLSCCMLVLFNNIFSLEEYAIITTEQSFLIKRYGRKKSIPRMVSQLERINNSFEKIRNGEKGKDIVRNYTFYVDLYIDDKIISNIKCQIRVLKHDLMVKTDYVDYIAKNYCFLKDELEIKERKVIVLNHCKYDYLKLDRDYKKTYAIQKKYANKIIKLNEYKMLNKEFTIDTILNVFAEVLSVQNLYIATGYLFNSGLELINDVINRTNNNNGHCKFIIGSLQNYQKNANKTNSDTLLGMDKYTARKLNCYMTDNLIDVKTFEDSFYHGKIYILKGIAESIVIVGSSNVSKSAYYINNEVDMIYRFNNTSPKFKDFLSWFSEFWKCCTEIRQLEESYFNSNEMEYKENLKLTTTDFGEIKTRIEALNDTEVRYRLNLWLERKPSNIYKDLHSSALNNYILFEYKERDLYVFESFEAKNSYICFVSNNVFELLESIREKSKNDILNIKQMVKRGYHIKNKKSLEEKINSLFSDI